MGVSLHESEVSGYYYLFLENGVFTIQLQCRRAVRLTGPSLIVMLIYIEMRSVRRIAGPSNFSQPLMNPTMFFEVQEKIRE